MVKKWLELARKSLETGDEVQKSWDGEYNGKKGFIVFSKKKVLFVEEKGFITTSVSLILDIPYEKIKKLDTENNQLAITKSDGTTEYITTNYLNLVKNELKNLTS